MFVVHFLSQHSNAPGDEHLNAMKCIYHYLIRTQNLRLIFHGNLLNANLIGFSDSDWAIDPNSQRPVSGYTFIFCGAAIAWSAKKQLSLALLSTKANSILITHSSKELTFLT